MVQTQGTQGRLPERMQRKFCCFCKKELKSLDGHVKTQYGPVCPTCFGAMKYCHFCKKELKSLDDYVKTEYGMVCIPCYDKKRGGRPKKEIDKQKLFQLKKEGKTVRKIAKQLKVSPSLVQRRLKEGGVTKGKKGGRRPKKEIDTEKIFQMRREGKTISKIAKELNVSVGFVHKRLKEGEVKE